MKMTTNVEPGQGESYWVLGDLYTIKAKSEDTLGAYGLVEVIFQPQGGAPPHIHEDANESFYILSGEIEFQIEEETILGTAGSFVHIPKGSKHTFSNKSATQAKALVWVTPGGLEKFFAAVGTKVEDASSAPPAVTPADVERLVSVALDFDVKLVTPTA
jgi:quercetin dioxygenase-like cupin family protein